MIKEGFLKLFSKDLEYEVSKIYNLLETSKEYSTILCTDEFYTPNIWKKISNQIDDIHIFTNGIFSESDRRQILFIPKVYISSIEKENIENFKSKLIKIEVNSKFKKYGHKDFLGSIMSLNIKRELIGDIIIEENIAYVPVSEKILKVVLLELKEIGKAECNIEVIDNYNYLPKYKYDEKIITVPSKRIDSVISSIINISRNKAVEAIESGKIIVDYSEEKNKSKILEKGMTITIKGYGKYKLFEEIGYSKKGKEKLIIKKYV